MKNIIYGKIVSFLNTWGSIHDCEVVFLTEEGLSNLANGVELKNLKKGEEFVEKVSLVELIECWQKSRNKNF